MKKFLWIFIFLGVINSLNAQSAVLSSPDKSLSVKVSFNDKISFEVYHEKKSIIPSSIIDLKIDGETIDLNKKIRILPVKGVKNEIKSVVPLKDANIINHYNELTIDFKNYKLQFRAYNDGVAYRWITDFKNELIIDNEIIDLNFHNPTQVWYPEENSLISHYERLYEFTKTELLKKEQFCSLPVLFKSNEVNVLFTETDLFDYPNLFLKSNGHGGFKSLFPGVVKSAKPEPGRRVDRNQIIESEEYIAVSEGKRSFPWRVFIISENDADLIESNLTFQLARENQIEDPSWIKAGKVAWDWYNANNIYGVDFESGINNNTYKYYIDFASTYGLEYIILDEGWSKSTWDITEYNPEIDVQELVRYGEEKNVGVILWVLWGPLNEDIDEILKLYNSWGVKGIKVDFMQRTDQEMVNYYEDVARIAAKYELLVDYHGSYKPAGLRRAYPNVLTYEGVKGNENNKWSQWITPEHNVTIPFIRMVAGPMDYTPGAMINANLKNHKVSFDRPMSIGTRCHQVAMYVIYESPLQMLCESPSTYLKEHETTNFISQIPSVWDETKVLDAKIGDYVIIARRKGEDWYIGAMTDENSREIEIDLSFLAYDQYELQIMQDGPNATKHAQDYQYIKTVLTNKKIKIKLAEGGGWAAILTKK